MIGDDHGRTATPRDDEHAPRGGEAEEPANEGVAGRVPDPEPEEAPELLGERSDHPIVRDGEEG